MALQSQENISARYQSPAYRGLIQELKGSRSDGTTLITMAGAPRAAMRPAAEVIAASLGLGIYRVDLSQVVSKYIGETEKNLRNVFKTADARSWVLLFDEADSLFGKRADVQGSESRHANAEASYLANVLAAFGGIIIALLTHPGPEIATRGRTRHVRIKYPPD